MTNSFLQTSSCTTRQNSAAESRAVHRLSLVDTKYGTHSLKLDILQKLQGRVPSLDLVQLEKKQLRKHHRYKKLGDCFKYTSLTISYKGGYFSCYRLWNRSAKGPSDLTKDEWAKMGSEVALLISSLLPRQPEKTSLNTGIVNATEGWDDTIWKGFSQICIIINTCISGIN